MQILVADDDITSRIAVRRKLMQLGYDVVMASDGPEALAGLLAPGAPALAILDWVMPGMEGTEVCRRIRAARAGQPLYIILLTSKDGKEHIVEGLDKGANDFISKPFDPDELRARVRVGQRVVELELSLAEKVRTLENALTHIKTLQGILPICMYCHKIRTDKQVWERLEQYIVAHTDAQFSHGLCPDCEPKFWESHNAKT